MNLNYKYCIAHACEDHMRCPTFNNVGVDCIFCNVFWTLTLKFTMLTTPSSISSKLKNWRGLMVVITKLKQMLFFISIFLNNFSSKLKDKLKLLLEKKEHEETICENEKYKLWKWRLFLLTSHTCQFFFKKLLSNPLSHLNFCRFLTCHKLTITTQCACTHLKYSLTSHMQWTYNKTTYSPT